MMGRKQFVHSGTPDDWSRCDEIALAAFQGMLAGVGSPHVSLKPYESVQAAYGYADAFLAVREDRKPKSSE
jgi:hypothetical protein